MEEWVKQILTSGQFSLLAIPAALLLGLSTFAGAATCCLPAVAIVAGYAGAGLDNGRKQTYVAAGSFFGASVLALAAAGALISYFGQKIGSVFGFYGEIIVGLIAVFFGFAALGLLPFHLPALKIGREKYPGGIAGAALLGMGTGAASVTCAVTCCAPVQLPLVLGMATLSGKTMQGALILGLFAVGYSLPLAALMLGISLGKTSTFMTKISKPLQIVLGIFLIVIGIWIILP